ncbi:ATP-binding protein [Indioceanicola profundi]|uniref:ATP-binding protein n=1 Tax=Indioceanicola profundi TaxID=2220096 RepID=UPI000E6A998D|nr:winged helix-turn-helix domain-containing protein [Indioceanicola profundi]
MNGVDAERRQIRLPANRVDDDDTHPAVALSQILPLPKHNAEIVFGPFRLFPEARMLFHGETAVRIGSRALEILIALARQPGTTVASDELLAAIWPGIHVESNTLRVHIAALRKVLGAQDPGHDYIANVTGRGYALIPPPVATRGPAFSEGRAAGRKPLLLNPPRLIGRNALLAQIRRQLRRQRLVTLVGPGGGGKSALAMQIAARTVRDGGDVEFIDFSPLNGGDLLTTHIASHLGLAGNSLDATATILRYVADRRMLLVLDTCEHVIAAAARFANAVLAAAPDVRILATSREALRVADEHVRPVHGLTVPTIGEITLREVLASPAGQLLGRRAEAASADVRFGEDDAPAIAEICRTLDGLPLAIEFAAALVPHFGAKGLARGLADRFALLKNGYRTALLRHQTLRATVDWSYRLLTDHERVVFRRFGVFSSAVPWDSAVDLLPLRDLDSGVVSEALRALAAKSLIEIMPSGDGIRCRMLDTTREFARAELETCGELDVMARHHAEYWAAWLETWAPDAAERAGRWQDCEAVLANVRSALNWCWSDNARHALGIRLSLAAVPLWANLSLIGETIENVERALDASDVSDQHATLRLYAALGGALMNIYGGGERVTQVWTRVLHLAEQRDVGARLQALWGLWVGHRNDGDVRNALEIAEIYARLAGDADDSRFIALGDRMRGVSYFFVGRFAEARACIERTLAGTPPAKRRAQIAAFQFDQAIAARCFQAQIAWMQGYPDLAMTVAAKNVEDAVACDHAGSLSYALSEGACPVALHNGDFDSLERFVALLLTRTRGPGLEIWHTLGRCFESLLLLRLGNKAIGLQQLEDVLCELRANRHGPIYTLALGEFALALADAGRAPEAESVMRAAFTRLERNGELWCSPELKRIKAELAVRSGGTEKALHWFAQSLRESREQGAVAWELRAATGLARLHLDKGCDQRAADALAAVLARYSEGTGTKDVLAARAVLDALR